MNIKSENALLKLKSIAEILRSENGCAWDRAQTSRTLKSCLIEEAYELYDAIDTDDPAHMKEELGDLLYQIYAHAQISSEEGLFSIEDVAEAISEKLIRRHPHVFGDEKADNPAQVLKRWEEIKKEEKKERESVLDGVPNHLPALLKSYRMQEKASRRGFDWDKIEDVEAKLAEELKELTDAVNNGSDEEVFHEAGDVLFSVVNLLRFRGINAEEALQSAAGRFSDRFRLVEKKAETGGKNMTDYSLDELDAFWEEAKSELKG